MKAAVPVVLWALLSPSWAEEFCQKENDYEEEDCSAGKTSERVVKLANGVLMPEVGFGTWKITEEKDIFKALDASLGSGYRLIDTAVVYSNHRAISSALAVLLAEHGVSREEIFLTSKIPTRASVPSPDWPNLSNCRAGLEAMLVSLDTEYLDLLLIHSPPATEEERREAWLCLEEFYREGKARAVGVSNYEIHHLEEIQTFSSVRPLVNQIYYNPLAVRRQEDLVSYCRQHNIHLTAFTSLGNAAPNRLLNNKLTHKIANKYERSVAQVLLRWATQQGLSVIPKSLNPEHIRDDIDLSFSMKAADLEKISSIFD